MPADLPVEQRARFELHVNIAAARKLGLSVPESLLLRANRVIE
jgi:putative ABC transport system substrate-binding protein